MYFSQPGCAERGKVDNRLEWTESLAFDIANQYEYTIFRVIGAIC